MNNRLKLFENLTVITYQNVHDDFSDVYRDQKIVVCLGMWTDDTTDAERESRRGIYTSVLARVHAKYLELDI